jgi:hypothetical protein
MVRDPYSVIAYLADKLALPKPERMLQRLSVPSSSKGKSDQATQRLLDSGTAQRSGLVEKWQRQVNVADQQRAMEILTRFQVDAYKAGEVLPAERLWIRPRASDGSLVPPE